MTEYHRLSAEQFAALAGGLGGPEVVRELNASRISHHLLLLKFLEDHWPSGTASDVALTALSEVQQAAPAVYRDMLGDPLVGAWLTRTVLGVVRGEATDRASAGELGQIGNLAAATAFRAGVDARLIGHAVDGWLELPALGRLLVDRDGPALIRVAAGTAVVEDTAGDEVALEDETRWQPHRYLRQGDISIRIEDVSRYRDGYHARPSERLTDDQVAAWRSVFGQAWQLLVAYLPERAEELALGLRAVVPLHDQGDGSARSGTARESVGALGLTPPHSAEDFVITLVHEYQHSKLSALLDMIELYHLDGTELHRVPWRSDPRPTSGLIQGEYAFLAVADAWRALRTKPELADVANEQFEKVRRQVESGYAALAGSAELTGSGAEFVVGMRPALDRLLAEPAVADRS